MKKDIHPEYRIVAFHDLGVDKFMMVRSTTRTERTIDIDGVTYPYITLGVSAYFHPF